LKAARISAELGEALKVAASAKEWNATSKLSVLVRSWVTVKSATSTPKVSESMLKKAETLRRLTPCSNRRFIIVV